MFDWELNSFGELYSITIWLAPRLIDATVRGSIDIAGTWGTPGLRAAAHRMKWGAEPATDVKTGKLKEKGKMEKGKKKGKKKGAKRRRIAKDNKRR